MMQRFPAVTCWALSGSFLAWTAAPASAQPAATQPAPAPAAQTQPTTHPATQPVTKITLNFMDAPLDAVLDHLSEAAGMVVVKDGPVDGRVTVLSKQPITPDEAVALLNAVLKNNGFTAITSGRTLTIISRDKAKKGGIPVHFGADPEAIEATAALITQVVPLRNLDAVKLKADLQPLLSTDADVTATAGSNAIIITDASVNIRRLVQIISGLDTKQSILSDIRIVQLKHANAGAAAKLIGNVFKGDAGPAAGQPGMPPQQPGQPMPGGGAREGPIPGGGVDQALRGGKVNAAADERTNTLVITGPVETLKVIDDLLKRLDVDPSNAVSEIRSFTLKFAQAEATAKLVTSIFKTEQKDQDQDRYSYYYGPRMPQESDQGQTFKINVAFDERTNTVIVTAPQGTLEMIAKIIKDLDANPVATSELRVFQLKHADAWSVSGLIEDTFNPKDNDNSEGFFRYFYYGMSTPTKKGAKITAVSDDRTNSVIVTAPSEMLKAIEDVVKKLDSNPISEETLFIYRLKNGQADNLELVLNTLFGNISQPQQQQQNNGNQPFNGDQQQQQQQNTGSGRSSRSRSSRRGDDRNSSNRRGGARNGRGRTGNTPQLSPGLTRAITELSGEVFVVADLDTNALIVTTAAKYESLVRQIIDELDRPVPQVLIKVLVAEVTHDDSSDLGVDFSILNSRSGGFGQSYGTQFGAPTNPSGLVVRLVEPDITATLHALAQAGKLEVLSRPYVLASDNQLARITVGQQVPFITNSRVTDLGQTINTVEYDDIGIILYVTPHINPDGLVILDVAPEISSLSANSIPISNDVSVPIINTRSAESRVGVKTGHTIVIGGLMEDQKRSSVDKVPILGDIPGLNLIFSRRRVTKTKTELLIFLTPHVAQEPDSLQPMSTQEVEGTKLTPKAITPGTFDEHLKGMERGNVPQTQPARSSTSVFRPGGQAEIPDVAAEAPTTRPNE